MAFVHLHNHSDFSILDGATPIPDMVKRAVDFGMPAVAITMNIHPTYLLLLFISFLIYSISYPPLAI